MGLLNVPKLVDYRNKVKKHKTNRYAKRTNGVKSITDIAIHHSLTMRKLAGSTAEGYARFHVDSLGWPGIGYTYVIEADGTIKYVNNIEDRTYHVGNHNNYAVGIVLSGDFRHEEPTDAQKESLRNLVTALKKKYPHIKNVKGHSDYKGYEWKACPVFDYKKVLAGKVTASKPKPNPTKPKPSKNNVKLAVDGYWGPATTRALQRYFGTPVDGYLSKPSLLIKAMQKWLGTTQDGYISEPYSLMVVALQKRFGTPQDGYISKPSLMVKEMQRRLNNGKL